MDMVVNERKLEKIILGDYFQNWIEKLAF